MTNTTTFCIRGCTIHGRHTNCVDDNCPGCQPRPTTTGQLCGECLTTLEELLSQDTPGSNTKNPKEGVVFAACCVDYAIDRGTRAARYDTDRVGVSKNPPPPVTIDRIDLLDDINNTVLSWLSAWLQHKNTKPPHPIQLTEACRILQRHTAALAAWEPVADMISELEDLTRRAHAIAPWRPAARHCAGVACPYCQATQLFVYDGDDAIVCRRCMSCMNRDEYTRWVGVLADKETPKPISHWASEEHVSVGSLRMRINRQGIKPDKTDRNGRKLYLKETIAGTLTTTNT